MHTRERLLTSYLRMQVRFFEKLDRNLLGLIRCSVQGTKDFERHIGVRDKILVKI